MAALGLWSDVVLAPLRTGYVDGLSFAVYPFCRPLSGSRYGWAARRAIVRRTVLRWLRGAAAATVSEVTDKERLEGFVQPLEGLVRWTALSVSVRSAASVALHRLEDGLWQPRCCLMHGDLWKGNILVTPRGGAHRHIVFIDWGASMVRGYGMYDLFRLTRSTKLSCRRLQKEVRTHCELLGCEFIDAASHLLAALGYIGANLNCFPFRRYLEMTHVCMDQLKSIGV